MSDDFKFIRLAICRKGILGLVTDKKVVTKSGKTFYLYTGLRANDSTKKWQSKSPIFLTHEQVADFILGDKNE